MTPRAPAAAEPRRQTPTERHHDEMMALITKAPRPGQESFELGESAQKVAYVKSLMIYRENGEGWKPWADRGLAVLAYLRAGLPEATGAPEKPRKTVVHVQSRRKA